MGGAPRTYACIRTSEVEIPFTTKLVAEDQQKESVAMQSHCRLIRTFIIANITSGLKNCMSLRRNCASHNLPAIR